jgi:hypothetical protein
MLKTGSSERLAALQFRAAISYATDARFEKHGRYSAEEILDDIIAADNGGWAAIRDQLARRAALGIISAQMRQEPRTVDDNQLKLWPELPVSRISYKHSIVASQRASVEEFLWYERWFENWCSGRVRRSEEDSKTLASIQRFGTVLRRYAGKDLTREVAGVVEERKARLEALRKLRKNRARKA